MAFAELRPVNRFLILAVGTTPPLILMLTVFMPLGFAGVPYMVLVLLVFVGLFAIVAALERSLALNLFVVLLFWISISVLHVLNPGTAPGRLPRIVDGILLISLLAVIHASIQSAIPWSIRKVTFNGKEGAQQGVAAGRSHR